MRAVRTPRPAGVIGRVPAWLAGDFAFVYGIARGASVCKKKKDRTSHGRLVPPIANPRWNYSRNSSKTSCKITKIPKKIQVAKPEREELSPLPLFFTHRQAPRQV
jgi:hypothetical protein